MSRLPTPAPILAVASSGIIERVKRPWHLGAVTTVVMATAGLVMSAGCSSHRRTRPKGGDGGRAAASHGDSRRLARPARPTLGALEAGEVYLYDKKTAVAARISEAQARAGGLLVVDLSDGWAPFIFQDGGGGGGDGEAKGAGSRPSFARNDTPRPNGYRQTFVALANDRINPDGRALERGGDEHNFLEPFGIPPTLSVLRARVERDAAPDRQDCLARVDGEALRAFTGTVPYLDREHARREHAEALRDAAWLNDELARRKAVTAPAPPKPNPIGTLAALRADPDSKVRTRAERAVRGQQRERAVRAVQSRLVCEGLLSPRTRFTQGMFDLPTHEALAEWERKNDIFGWALLGGETLAALSRPVMDLNLETLRRILAERVADAAGILEDGSIAKGMDTPTYRDGRASHPIPNLIEQHVAAVLASVHVTTPEDMVAFLRQHDANGWATLRVALVPPALPPYYGPAMQLSVEIDRGDVWYDFPFDARGHAIEQNRQNYPHLTLFVSWQGQTIPLCRWRTTIGSWRSELHANGKIYYKYKNSDVGPRFWRNIVAGPVWIPPDATPAKDLLTRKVLDRNKGPEVVVNTEVMGPGFQSAYGLVMAIHIDRAGFDNQIRTHGSVDYTSIARRFSHGCHRLVNNRAVRLFDFVLRHQPFRRVGAMPLGLKRNLVVDGKPYAYELKTRGYYYELLKPLPVNVLEGRVMGQLKAPLLTYVRKSGVDYSDVERPPALGAPDRNSGNDVASPDTATDLRIPDAPAAPTSSAVPADTADTDTTLGP